MTGRQMILGTIAALFAFCMVAGFVGWFACWLNGYVAAAYVMMKVTGASACLAVITAMVKEVA